MVHTLPNTFTVDGADYYLNGPDGKWRGFLFWRKWIDYYSFNYKGKTVFIYCHNKYLAKQLAIRWVERRERMS